MKPFLVFLLFTLFPGISNAYITNLEGRKQVISLNGKWQFLIDPYETGYYDYRYQPSNNGFFKNAKATGKDGFVEYGFDQAEQINVPGDWNSQFEKLDYYEGTLWYKKSFIAYKSEYERNILHFGAVNYRCIVYLNGEKVGEHEGGFTPFQFEVTDKLKNGDNFIVVKVDNKRLADGVPTLNTDWWNYGGITREVSLVTVPLTFIEDYFLQVKKGTKNEIQGWVRLNGPSKKQKVTFSIPNTGVKLALETDTSGWVAFTVKANLKLWSPENPTLYQVTWATERDTVSEATGFRTLDVKETEILLNGKPVFLRGICIHEEIPERKGRAWSESDARQLLTWAKELGCNFVRLAHYPHNEHITRLADRMGILVWSEIPVYWTIQFDNEKVLEKARQQMTEMVTRDRNRASIIIWSVGNETPVSEARTRFLKALATTARQQDPSRLLSAALEIKGWEGEKPTIDDPAGEFLDILGCNEYVGWYVPFKKEPEQYAWGSHYNKPLIITEFGSEALYGNHGNKDIASGWTEEFQEQMYQKQIRMLKKIGFLRGTSPWVLADFRSPKRLLPRVQDGWNRKGLISDNGQKKKAFFVLKKFYEEKEKEYKTKRLLE